MTRALPRVITTGRGLSAIVHVLPVGRGRSYAHSHDPPLPQYGDLETYLVSRPDGNFRPGARLLVLDCVVGMVGTW